MTQPRAPHRLMLFAPAIDSELSRLVLSHYAVPYAEERHVFGWVSLLSLVRGGTVQVPLLHGGGLRLAGPRAMVDQFDQTCPPERKLVPGRQPARTAVETDWERFHGRLASSTAVLAYYHLLPHRDIMIEPFCRGIPKGEAVAVRSWGYTVVQKGLTILLHLSPASADDALTRIRAALDGTDARLADGRRYLNGGALTLADLALAAAMAPLLLPKGYAAPIPALEQMPPVMAAVVAECRARPTACFVQRIYAEHPPSMLVQG